MRGILQRALQKPWNVIGVVCVVLGGYATILRFTRGLGASTNLSDSFPWGMWVGFDVITGVGLAAGGFTLSAIVHLLGMERYKPLARPAILTAFVGYLLVIGGLLFDLGHPWRIWHPLIMWNPHSVMFEVAWCVTLYTTVLAAEMSHFVFERLQWGRATRITHRLTLPLTLAAVLLSMLHQSSLGSLFLIVPGRLHELWYTPLLPILFFLSAVSIGLVMAIIESNLSARAKGRAVEADVLRQVALLSATVMTLYLIVRFTDLTRSGILLDLWPLDRAGILFLLEVSLGFIIPIILFTTHRVTRNSRRLYHAAQIALLGFIINRINVAVSGFEAVSGKVYTPAWTEIAVTLMIITLGVTAYNLATRHLPVFERDPMAVERERRWKVELDRQVALGMVPAPAMAGGEGGT